MIGEGEGSGTVAALEVAAVAAAVGASAARLNTGGLAGGAHLLWRVGDWRGPARLTRGCPASHVGLTSLQKERVWVPLEGEGGGEGARVLPPTLGGTRGNCADNDCEERGARICGHEMRMGDVEASVQDRMGDGDGLGKDSDTGALQAMGAPGCRVGSGPLPLAIGRLTAADTEPRLLRNLKPDAAVLAAKVGGHGFGTDDTPATA